MQAKSLAVQAKKTEKEAELYKKKMYAVLSLLLLLIRNFRRVMKMEPEYTAKY